MYFPPHFRTCIWLWEDETIVNRIYESIVQSSSSHQTPDLDSGSGSNLLGHPSLGSGELSREKLQRF